jgi:stress response protein YsnF
MRTVRALFEREADAKAARERLRAQGVPPQRMSLIDRSRPAPLARDPAAPAGQGLWASLKGIVAPVESGGARDNGELVGGGHLLTVSVAEEELEGVLAILSKMAAVDFSQTDDEAGNARTVEEEHLPIVEERLRVGTLEREGGTVRVHSFANETAVHDRVKLVDYRVRVARRPVDRPVDDQEGAQLLDDLFAERSIELTETAEEVVFGKQARVREEVVVRKEKVERIEFIDESLRSTDVEVERLAPGSEGDPPLR